MAAIHVHDALASFNTWTCPLLMAPRFGWLLRETQVLHYPLELGTRYRPLLAATHQRRSLTGRHWYLLVLVVPLTAPRFITTAQPAEHHRPLVAELDRKRCLARKHLMS